MDNVGRLLGEYGSDIDKVMYIYSDESSESEETITFWKKGIDAYCNDEKTFSFTPSGLSIRFIHKDMIPTSADKSLAILKSRKDIVDSDFYNNRTIFQALTTSAAGWIGSFLVSQEISEKNLASKELLFVPLLKSVTEAFLKYILAACEVNHDQILVVYATRHCDVINLDMSFSNLLRDAGKKLNASQTESTVSKVTLSHRAKAPLGPVGNTSVSQMLLSMTDTSMCVFENYLVAEGYAVRSADEKILKIIPVRKGNENKNNILSPTKATKDATPITIMHGGTVTDVDVARLQLRSSISQLHKRIKALDAQAVDHKEKAIQFKKQGNDCSALMHLKLKKMSTELKEKTSNSLVSLISAYEQIGTAEFSAVVTGAYVTATKGLKCARGLGGLSPESIEDAADALNVELDNMSDINASLEDSTSEQFGRLNIDEDDLLKELETLTIADSVDSKWGSRAKVPVGFLRSTQKSGPVPTPCSPLTPNIVKSNSSRLVSDHDKTPTSTPKKIPSTFRG